MTPVSLRSWLDTWSPHFPELPGTEPQIAKAARQLERELTVDRPKTLELTDARALVARIENDWRRTGSLESTRDRELKHLGWIYFQPVSTDLWAPEFRSAYQEWSTRNRSGFRVASLFASFLLSYPEDDALRESWLTFFREALPRSTCRRAIDWWQRCEEYGLCRNDGPSYFARILTSSRAEPDDLLASSGLSGALGDARFLRLTFKVLPHRIGELLTSRADITRGEVSNWLSLLTEDAPRGARTFGPAVKQALRFEETSVPTAEGLLRPWVDRNPSIAVRDEIVSFLTRMIGDPRVKSHRWAEVSPEAQRVMRRWTAARTLDAFFEIIDKTALDTHWRDRKEFWERYVENGLVDDTWLVLGGNARREAVRLFSREERMYGILQNASASQSVLLLKIANCVVMEWSHKGAARMWPADDPRAPELWNRGGYDARFDLRTDCALRVARTSHSWRYQIRRWIRDMTGFDPWM